MKQCDNMADLREEIDKIDREIVPLLLERLQLIAQAGHIKLDRDTVRDEWRIEDVISKVKAEAAKRGGDTVYIETIYRHLIAYSIDHEFDVWDEIYGERKKRKA